MTNDDNEPIEFFQDGYNVPKEKKITPPWKWTSDEAERIMDICLDIMLAALAFTTCLLPLVLIAGVVTIILK